MSVFALQQRLQNLCKHPRNNNDSRLITLLLQSVNAVIFHQNNCVILVRRLFARNQLDPRIAILHRLVTLFFRWIQLLALLTGRNPSRIAADGGQLLFGASTDENELNAQRRIREQRKTVCEVLSTFVEYHEMFCEFRHFLTQAILNYSPKVLRKKSTNKSSTGRRFDDSREDSKQKERIFRLFDSDKDAFFTVKQQAQEEMPLLIAQQDVAFYVLDTLYREYAYDHLMSSAHFE